MKNFKNKTIFTLIFSILPAFGCEDSKEESSEPIVRDQGAGELAGEQAGETSGEMDGGIAGEDAGDQLFDAGEELVCEDTPSCEEGFVEVEGCQMTEDVEDSDLLCLPVSSCEVTIYCQEVLDEVLPEPSPFPESDSDMGV